MRIPPFLLPLLPLATSLVLLALLLRGIDRGELSMPIKGAGLLHVQLTSNPFGFYLLAALHLGLAALCAWLAVWLFKSTAGAKPRAASAPVDTALPRAHGAAAHSPAAHSGGFEVGIESQGRSGAVVLRLPEGEQRLYWEFGGGDCVVQVTVPDADQWAAHPVLSAYPRERLLAELGEVVRQRQCPQCRLQIERDCLRFLR